VPASGPDFPSDALIYKTALHAGQDPYLKSIAGDSDFALPGAQ